MSTYVPSATTVALIAAGLLLVGCAEDGDTTESTEDTGEAGDTGDTETDEHGEAVFNEADVAFARMMIPHHEQAIEMSELAEDRAGPEVLDLAEEIEAAQQPEIDQMQDMLQDWGVAPDEEMDHDDMDDDSADHADHADMEGMLSPEQMDELAAVEGAEFDELFVEYMIEHHEGAILMSEEVLAEGSSPEAHDLAEDIIAVQESEIDEMETLLDG
ncbi:DUF305 domain-containing protein [Lipingzhangella sp. LS1_29]|uniref:DUF305 domain-containing protein n=1 Tax=Lipingzhangella rawalii TaxID=2055835 RepID=A0ABU2HA61_9ACTN|nr:DUF305 domain-containing protein [Lipingzhangella rawalii]MDS1272173.1 DUF305 domain-containing protein [Lipingzhangella rawalii]